MAAKKIDYIFELGELFERVQMESIFSDSKTFVDCTPLASLPVIHSRYEEEKTKPEFSLAKFVKENFREPESQNSGFQTNKNAGIKEHISNLWDVLTKESKENGSSLIPLPKPFVVPGGRFRELFYWDSYFTMIGLQVDKRFELIENMIIDFNYMISKFKYIPNGNRTYFLGRSQPPVFSLMVKLLAEIQGEKVYADHYDALRTEYNFWMQGSDQLSTDQPAFRRVVDTGNKTLMNRYWDDNDTPRPEAYRKDMNWAKNVGNKKSFFRNERAACESGWDFSSRWFADGKNIETNRAINLIPVDLNCILWHLEITLEKIADQQGDKKEADHYRRQAEKRKHAIGKYCWDEQNNFYFDFDFVQKNYSGHYTLAAAFTLFFKLSTTEQAGAVAATLEKKFLKEGGFVTTLIETGQQWDAPNGWAPLEWIAIKGLSNYGFNDLAKEAARRWMHSNEIIFEKTGKLMEKYNVETKYLGAMPGTYPTQDGFGWTNGVYLALDALVRHL